MRLQKLLFALFVSAVHAQTASPPSTTFRFVFTALRDIDGKRRDGLQLSEINLFDDTGAQLTIDTASNPGGVSPNKRQKASSAIDGLKSTKWFDASIITLGSSELRLTLPAATQLLEYELFTANDNIKRGRRQSGRAATTSPRPPANGRTGHRSCRPPRRRGFSASLLLRQAGCR